ncbi:MAG: hypothetical protein AAF945_19290, partial [Actinomycetota bacterium]
DAVVEQYEEAQLDALRRGLLLAAFLAVISLAVTRHLPTRIRTDDDENVGDGVDEPVSPATATRRSHELGAPRVRTNPTRTLIRR